MTLNLAEASAVLRVLEHLTGRVADPVNRGHATREETIDALAALAESAYKKLSAGYNAERARAALETWPGTLTEVWMLMEDGDAFAPYASEHAARTAAAADWPEGSDLAWRTSDFGTNTKVLYVDGQRTLRQIWPEQLRGMNAVPGDAQGDDEAVAACKTCGCTEDEPCEGGCAWVTDGTLEIDLCTACAWAIARDAIASGLYHLEPTVGDTLFEARGGLIPQPALTEAEVEGLQPLIEALDAAEGDQQKLAEIASEHGLVYWERLDLSASVAPAAHRWQPSAADLVRVFPWTDPHVAAQAMRAMRTFAESLAQVTDIDASPVWLSPSTVTVYRQPPEIEAAAEQLSAFLDAWPSGGADTILALTALAPAGTPIPLRHSALRIVLDALVVSHLEWRVRGGGFVGPETSEAEARRYVTDQRRLFPNEGPGQHGIVQCRQVGPWVDAEVQP